ncbi:MAG: ribosomal protein S18-alanine N-acetyltransferase [Chitinispirillaceae bacterium]|nr:ribosomal protein S18-alanine N-acetyltransferase [Chitinispirillaceae bacterium]
MKHIDSICAIEAASFDPPWTRNDFINELGGGGSPSMILLNKGMLIGYLFSKKALDEITINKLCIHAEYRGRGYGNLLLYNFIEQMRGQFSRIFLEAACTNTTAIRLYTKNGFRVNRIRKAIYADGADAVEMVRGGEEVR